jgi:geranylgeranyl diphosphate synthase type II
MRPVLALAAFEAVSGQTDPSHDAVLPAACAVELVHTYSLVHDDLPCMDDDDTRRGRPTVHIQFGEALALLAGDALLTEAFALCANAPAYGPGVPAERILRATSMLAKAAGRAGMVGGQSIDLGFEIPVNDEGALTLLHLRKTGELFRFSAAVGALLGGASDSVVDAMGDYGEALGLAFQISDDLLDAAEDEEVRDAADTPSFPGLLGEELARHRCQELLARCDDLLSNLGPEAEPLRLLAWYAVHRDH